MNAHLLAMSIGPVQELIAAARRTRDLWFGSFLLSELSKAAAKAVFEQGGSLIFPAPESQDSLRPESRLTVANVILAALPDQNPAEVAAAAKAAVQARWHRFADRVKLDHQSLIDLDIWEDQADDVIEFYAAWVSYSPASYRTDRTRMMRLLEARKRCRDFAPAKGRAGIPKSSLDGLRETVLHRSVTQSEKGRPRLRLRKGEQLDVVAMVKRAWSPNRGARHYPSVARVAADPWLRGIGQERLQGLIRACEALPGEVIPKIDLSEERGHQHYKIFPFEGTTVFPFRHPSLQEETGLTPGDLDPLVKALTSLIREFGAPNPYLAVLVADGDRMGSALSKLESAGEHRHFSQCLAKFADQAREIVHAHSGVLVYAGGDDVLAFVPVDQCLLCARALYDLFEKTLEGWFARIGRVTLSVGIAIGHFMENLEDLLDFGRDAEKHAKQPRPGDGGQADRNALAVRLVRRGDDPIGIRTDWPAKPDAWLQALAGWLNDQTISGGVAYDLRKTAEVYEDWPRARVAPAIQADVLRVLKGKDPRGGPMVAEVEKAIRERVVDADSLRVLAHELLIARQVAVALDQAKPITTHEERAK